MTHLLLIIIYITFISLGLPDALLGSAWPIMHADLEVDFAASGLIFMIISGSTIISSLSNDYINRKLKTRGVVILSVLCTAIALFGFSLSHSYLALCLFAIPYGLGAGSIDASLNNYVALYYSARHMSWLHCMWGVGAMIGPYIMSRVLTGGGTWNQGYRSVSLIQFAITVILIISLPIWRNHESLTGRIKSAAPPAGANSDTNGINPESVKDHSAKINSIAKKVSEKSEKDVHLTNWQAIKLPGAKEVILTFLCYCGLEQSVGLWASSYLFVHHGLSEELAAAYGGLFFIGLTVGRFLSGFLTMIFNDTKMIRLGQMMILVGVLILFIPLGEIPALLGLVIIGLGAAPIFPCIIHATPNNFGRSKSHIMIGLQMGAAYLGNIILPPFLGVLGDFLGISIFPFFLLVVLLIMTLSYQSLLKKTGQLTAISKQV